MRERTLAWLGLGLTLAAPAAGQTGPAPAAAAAPVSEAAPVAEVTPAPPAPLPEGEPRLEEFAPLPGNVDVPWPTVESTTDGSPVEVEASVRYDVTVTGLTALGLQDEFQALSSLWTRRGDEANLAQINRRIVEDRDLVDQLLRSVGYYGGDTAVTVTRPVAGAPGSGRTQVAVTVTPGPLYTFDSISIQAPDSATGAPPADIVLPRLGVRVGDPVDAARVNAAQDALPRRLADAGYAFPLVLKPEIVIDHATRTASLVQAVDIGRRSVFGTLEMAGDTQGFDTRHLELLARFKPGQAYDAASREDLRRALIQTGLFGSVSIKPVDNGPVDAEGRQRVDLVVTGEAAPPRSVAAAGGYSTGQGIRLEGSWTHRNLFPPEGGVTVRAVGAEREQVLTGEFRRRNWRQRDQSLILTGGLSASQQFAYQAATLGLGATVLRESNTIWQKPWTYSLGVQLLATSQLDLSGARDNQRDTYFILAFPGSVTWDKSDDLLNPSRGFRVTTRISPEFTLREGSYLNYLKAQIDTTGYIPFGDFVLAGRLHLGTIAGADRGRIAPDRRFYAGGGGSVRGFDFQGVGPRDPDGTPLGGNSITEASLEARYRFQAFGNDLGVVAFVDAGNVFTGTVPSFDALSVGAGLGLRYYTSFGPVRIDVATPITRRTGDPTVAFYVSIGQAF